MSRSVTCYIQPGKAKSARVLEAFAAGSGAKLSTTDAPKLETDVAVFYGVRPGWAHLWEASKAEGRDYYYIDNAYFDVSRETSFRITRNALQCDGLAGCWSGKGEARFKALNLTVAPWQAGKHVVVCPQSDEFLSVVGYKGNWLTDALAVLKQHTDRTLVVRRKGERRPLVHDLKGAHALVTHMSCAAVEALLAGVPVFCTGRSAARWLGHGDLTQIEHPVYPERREEWAAVLSENQWTLDEIRRGDAWRDLKG